MIRHIVLYRLTAAAHAEGLDSIMEKLRASAARMAANVPGLLTCEVGPNLYGDSPHDLFYYCEFEKAEDIEAYLVHPLHEAHKDMAASWVENGEIARLESR
ncbi:MAG: Dabb family protein [Spirochaetaceae bacterium]|jgi:hypothetical protein|nr:Dabb family protein [Spirochaetaceae bacterium]